MDGQNFVEKGVDKIYGETLKKTDDGGRKTEEGRAENAETLKS